MFLEKRMIATFRSHSDQWEDAGTARCNARRICSTASCSCTVSLAVSTSSLLYQPTTSCEGAVDPPGGTSSGENLNVATESMVSASVKCFIVTVGLSCLVFEIWKVSAPIWHFGRPEMTNQKTVLRTVENNKCFNVTGRQCRLLQIYSMSCNLTCVCNFLQLWFTLFAIWNCDVWVSCNISMISMILLMAVQCVCLSFYVFICICSSEL